MFDFEYICVMKDFYIKVYSGSGADRVSTVFNLRKSFNIYVKSVPFLIFPKYHKVFSRVWFDRDGRDEYIPKNSHKEAFDMVISFVYVDRVGAFGSANRVINDFLSVLGGGYFDFYDDYTGIGRSGVRYDGLSGDVSFHRRGGVRDCVEFSLRFLVNNPSSLLLREDFVG